MAAYSNLKEALAEIERLKNENVELRKTIERLTNTSASPLPQPRNPSVTNKSSREEKITFFIKLFCGRQDVFARRWVSRNGRSGYSPACSNEWDKQLCRKPQIKCSACEHRALTPLSKKVIFEHLNGNATIGIYPLLKDNSCNFLAVDFDKQQWQEDTTAFAQTCKLLNVPYSIERSRSGNGAHIWIFFEEPVEAALARKLGRILLEKTMEQRYEIGMDSFDRMFPNQDTVPRGGFGNLIALPLQKESVIERNSLFTDDNFQPFKDQWIYLSSIKKMTKEEIYQITNHSIIREKNAVSLPNEVTAVLKNGIYFKKDEIPSMLLTEIIKTAVFSNPEFYKAQAKRLSTHKIPRYFDCSEDAGDYIVIPRGCLEKIKEIFGNHKITLELEDKTNKGEEIDPGFHGQLTSQQEEAVNSLTEVNNGVLAAETGFGKTVTGAALIARNKVNTLIIVHRNQLIDQWKAQLSNFLQLPESSIGQIGGGKNNAKGIVDIATIQSLNRQGKIKSEITKYGQVIVDECHHISAFSFEKVLKLIRASKVYGLSATPVRKDGLHPIIFMQCGAVRYKTDSKKQAKIRPFTQKLIKRETSVVAESKDIQVLYTVLGRNKKRNELLFNDVLIALEAKRSPIVLTERVEHAEELYKQFKGFAKNIIMLTGALKKKERKLELEKLLKVSDQEERLIIATGKYIGEGFDDARLDTLFLAMPISWRGTLQQYAGRLHRIHSNKTEVQIYDYVDEKIPVFKNMYDKRLKGYKAMGYKETGNKEQGETEEQMKLF